MKLLVLSMVGMLAFTHDYFISVCDVEYNATEQVLEIAIKMTTHDLEHAATLKHLGTELEDKEADKTVFDYLKKNFSIQIDDEEKELEWVGKQVELEDIWIYVQIQRVEEFSSLKMFNSILCAHFEEQQNRVNIKVPWQADQSATFTKLNSEHEFLFAEE
jgi:predicted DNA binding CopG/RHH family protein